ncbi:MAG: hypothetical protein LUQ49_03810 [Methanomicrobiales archaeon]|nr:hypothetical protein [Methanomicrobiales archaeon]
MAFLQEHGWDENFLNDTRVAHRYLRYDEWVFRDREPQDKEMKDFLDFLDSPLYNEMLERKREPEKKQYRPYRYYNKELPKRLFIPALLSTPVQAGEKLMIFIRYETGLKFKAPISTIYKHRGNHPQQCGPARIRNG